MSEDEFWAMTPRHFNARVRRWRLERVHSEMLPAMAVSALTHGKTPWKRLVLSALPSDFAGPAPRTPNELRAKIDAAFGRVIAFRKAEKRLGRGG